MTGRVRLAQLCVENFRNLESLVIEPLDGLNQIQGANGAGKTSVLETVYLLGRGRSFRPGRAVQMIREGRERFRVTGRVEQGERARRIGVQCGTAERVFRLDGEAVDSLAVLNAALPTLVFEPHSHELVEGGPEHRRRYLDWGVFHVEHGFLAAWRRYRRALRQRNAALRGQDIRTAGTWEPEMAASGARLSAMRSRYARRLAAALAAALAEIAPELGGVAVAYRAGWEASWNLGEAIEAGREQDARQGFSGVGPHRDDLRITLDGRSAARRLSRGQEKLVALALVLCQARLFAEDTGNGPVMLLDDLPSELDGPHLERSVAAVAGLGCQSFVTAVAEPPAFDAWPGARRRFHVEQGALVRVV